MPTDRNIREHDSGRVTEGVSWTKRSYYSIGWLTTADIMSTRAEEIGGGDTRPDEVAYDEMRSCVLSAVTASATFLESHINELFDDACEYADRPNSKALHGLDRETQVRMAALWPHSKMHPVMVKYDIALDLAEVDALGHGEEPAQSASDLIQLRNYLLHYRPNSVRNGVAQGEDLKLSSGLRNRLTLPTWDDGGEDLFPTRAICPGLARWAVQSSIRFTDAFSRRLQVNPNYDHVRPQWIN
jgi:hypothetical protein